MSLKLEYKLFGQLHLLWLYSHTILTALCCYISIILEVLHPCKPFSFRFQLATACIMETIFPASFPPSCTIAA
ncbi:hypothetical protein EYC80_005102 [Monilinia laxa]|uniref:Uncharacterized protein n=1 Tax=Monilinia laxa TaxID=61186 RepID=A0A5N6KJ74_MONLA|nr:hypothetical protein EYC80_005102 [Monilinia laxa]